MSIPHRCISATDFALAACEAGARWLRVMRGTDEGVSPLEAAHVHGGQRPSQGSIISRSTCHWARMEVLTKLYCVRWILRDDTNPTPMSWDRADMQLVVQ